MRIVICFFFLLVASLLAAQPAPQPLSTTDEQARTLAATITSDDLRAHLTVLAADDMEGRATGEPGQKRAAAYLRTQMVRMGLPPIGEDDGYFQTIVFKRQKWEEIELKLMREKLRHLWEYASPPSENTHRERVNIGELLFLGYGIDDERYSDYTGVDVQDKHLLIFAGTPQRVDGRPFIPADPDWNEGARKKLEIARSKGAATVFIIDPEFKQNVRNIRKETLDGRNKMAETSEADRQTANVVYLTPTLAQRIMGRAGKKIIKSRKRIERKGHLKPITIPTDLQLTQRKNVTEMIGENVLGYVEGTDPMLKGQVLVVSAHYDHIGRRGTSIFNGADDNGSGTSTVLEVAEAFATAARQGLGPRRSVLFLLVSGEENGLLGSQYYAAHPYFPLDSTIANINVDMVGRVDEKHADDPAYIYVIGADRLSSELHAVNERMNATFTGLELDYTYNDEDDPNRYYYRSDHYNFAKNGIPSVFFFNGTHPDYHQATDTIEKINFEKMETIGRLVFHTAWQLSNQDRRIQVDVK